MRKLQTKADEASWRRQVAYLINKATISSEVPHLTDMEVGEIRVLETTSSSPSDYKLYVKLNRSTIVSFCGCSIFGAAFDTGFSDGFEVQH